MMAIFFAKLVESRFVGIWYADTLKEIEQLEQQFLLS